MRVGRTTAIIWLIALTCAACGSGGNTREKLAQIRVWEDQGWTANGRLASFLSDRSDTVRIRAALALGRVDDTLSLDSLHRALMTDPNPRVRGMAAFSMGIWTWGKITKAALLEAVAKETDQDALVPILHSLGRIYAREEHAAYLKYLRHSDPRVRAQTALTLDMVNVRDKVDSVLILLDDPDATVRRDAMFALTRMGTDKAVGTALKCVNDPDPATRLNAYRLLGSARVPERVEVSSRGFADPDPSVRCIIADGCLGMRDTALLYRGLEAVEANPDVALTQRLLRAYAEIGHANKPEVIDSYFHHPDPTLRAQAVLAFCNAAGLPCWDKIIPAANDPDWRVRIAIFDAVDKLTRFGQEVDLTPLRDVVTRLLDDPSPRVRARALQLAVTFGMPGWGELLNRLYHDTSDFVVAQAVSLIGANHILTYVDSLYQLYTEHFDDPDPEVKWAITASSANMLPSFEIDSLRQDIFNWGLADPNRLVRWYTVAVTFKFRQDRRDELGTYLTDLTVTNIDSLLPNYGSPPKARIETTRGTFIMELDPNWAPRTTRKFIALAQGGYYNETPVKELQGGQMVVLGDRVGDESALPPADLRDEYSPVPVDEGSVLWSISVRDGGRGVFMIAHTRLGYQDWRFPVFARVTEGMDVVRSMTLADTIRTVTIETQRI